MSDFIPVNEPLLGQKVKEYVNDCLNTNWISSEGPYVEKFQDRFARRVGRKHGIAVCNGSMALEAAVRALGIGTGDEVILPAFTIISCASAVVKAGATPVLVDCDPITRNMDVSAIEDKITPRTRAIMVVHIYGLPVDMDPVLRLADKHKLLVIEDAAEAIGQVYRGKPCGSFGDVSVFSFYPNKLVTTGEGGMIVTNDAKISEKCQLLRNLYFENKQRFVHDDMGWNLRMTNIQAAIGLAQLESLDEHVARKIQIGEIYTKLLESHAALTLPVAETEYARNHYWVYGLVLNDGISMVAKEAMSILAENGVGTRPFFYPMNRQPVFERMGMFGGVQCPVSERIAVRGFYIPSGLALTDEQAGTVANTVHKVIQ